MLDGCSCCPVCARQRGESCSPLLPCDESGGLYCDRGPDDSGDTGICMGKAGGGPRAVPPACGSPPKRGRGVKKRDPRGPAVRGGRVLSVPSG